jgi:hypothetical protein
VGLCWAIALNRLFASVGRVVSADPGATLFDDADDRMFYEGMRTGEAGFLIASNLANLREGPRMQSLTVFSRVWCKHK